MLGKTYQWKVSCSRECAAILKSWEKWLTPPVTYKIAHNRLTFALGAASNRNCSCGARAKDWAFVGSRESDDSYPFSGDFDDYAALCRDCHRQLDMAA